MEGDVYAEDLRLKLNFTVGLLNEIIVIFVIEEVAVCSILIIIKRDTNPTQHYILVAQ